MSAITLRLPLTPIAKSLARGGGLRPTMQLQARQSLQSLDLTRRALVPMEARNVRRRTLRRPRNAASACSRRRSQASIAGLLMIPTG